MLEFLYALSLAVVLILGVQYLRDLVAEEEKADGLIISTHPYIPSTPLAQRPVKNTGVQFMMKGRMY